MFISLIIIIIITIIIIIIMCFFMHALSCYCGQSEDHLLAGRRSQRPQRRRSRPQIVLWSEALFDNYVYVRYLCLVCMFVVFVLWSEALAKMRQYEHTVW